MFFPIWPVHGALAHGRRLAAVDNGAADNLRARVDEK
jgi:hypothetical protein